MTDRAEETTGAGERPRLTPRGCFALASVYLAVGPTAAYGFGVSLSQLNDLALYALVGRNVGMPQPVALYGLLNVLMSPVVIVVGLHFYGPWADIHLWPVAAWVAATMTLVATSRRGLRVGDAALVAAAAVLVYPALVDADGPQLKWGYPDAVYMALAAAGGAALCTALVRGFGEKGLRRRVAWGWVARRGGAAAPP